MLTYYSGGMGMGMGMSMSMVWEANRARGWRSRAHCIGRGVRGVRQLRNASCGVGALAKRSAFANNFRLGLRWDESSVRVFKYTTRHD